ncbi:MAG TPA: urease accessory protein UreF [Chitinophagaceae bacterium]|jgi:urease accessory protein|nr:urease accessory protein UreF [Chitinophagaceae bacterium]
MNSIQLLRLLQLADPALPIGGFAHSWGLETYVQRGKIRDAAAVSAYIEAVLRHSIRYTDAALVSLCWEAARSADLSALLHWDELCTAVKLPRELREGSVKLGSRLSRLLGEWTQDPLPRRFEAEVRSGSASGHYPVWFGLYASVLGLPKEETLTGFYFNAASGMITNAVKLVPLGQGEGQRVLFGLQALLESLVAQSLDPDPECIGLCCPGFDIRSMQHERLYSRLYMS